MTQAQKDNTNYKIIGAAQRGGIWIVAAVSMPPAPLHYCLRYTGAGQYFNTLEDLNEYARRTWNKEFSFNGGAQRDET